MKKRKLLLVAILLFILIILLFYAYLYFFQEDKVAILTYHNVVKTIDDDPNTTVNISVEKFEKQIKWLSENGYKSITMNQLYSWKEKGTKIPRKSVLITFDDGWTSYYTNALPILEKYNMKSSVFIIWKYTESAPKENNTYINLDQIKDIKKNHSSAEILSHSYNLHIQEYANSKDYNLYNRDIEKVSTIEENIKYYAYPFGKRNTEYIKALKDNEYHFAFTFGPYDFVRKNDNNYEIPRIGLFESTPDWKFKLKMFLEI